MKMIRNIEKNIEKIRARKYIRIRVGVFLLILGVIGGFLPIVQGWIFIVLGLTVLFGDEFVNFLEGTIEKIKGRFKR